MPSCVIFFRAIGQSLGRVSDVGLSPSVSLNEHALRSRVESFADFPSMTE